jgi:hypothetical protein
MKENAFMFTRVLHAFGIQPVRKRSAVQETTYHFILDDPRKLGIHGLKGVKRGETLEVVNLGKGKWRVAHPSTGHSITRNIRDILAGGRRPMFQR